VRPLSAALGSSDGHARERAALALRFVFGGGRLDTPVQKHGALLAPAARLASGPLRTALRDESAKVRKHAAWTLGSLAAGGSGDNDGAGGSTGSVAALLIALLVSDTDAEVRRNAAHALGHALLVVDPAATATPVGLLARALADDADEGVRRHAAQALGRLGALARPAAAALAQALGDPHPDVRRNAAAALNATGGAGVTGGIGSSDGERDRVVLVAQLAKALQDPNHKVRKSATQTLGKLGELGATHCAAAAVLLVDATTDEHQAVRRSAVEALGKVAAGPPPRGRPGLPPSVVAGMGQVVLLHADMDIRRRVAVVLSRLGEGARPAASALREAAVDLKTRATSPNGDGDDGARRKALSQVLGLVTCLLARL